MTHASLTAYYQPMGTRRAWAGHNVSAVNGQQLRSLKADVLRSPQGQLDRLSETENEAHLIVSYNLTRVLCWDWSCLSCQQYPNLSLSMCMYQEMMQQRVKEMWGSQMLTPTDSVFWVEWDYVFEFVWIKPFYADLGIKHTCSLHLCRERCFKTATSSNFN